MGSVPLPLPLYKGAHRDAEELSALPRSPSGQQCWALEPCSPPQLTSPEPRGTSRSCSLPPINAIEAREKIDVRNTASTLNYTKVFSGTEIPVAANILWALIKCCARHFISFNSHNHFTKEELNINATILRMMKLKLKEVKECGHGHTRGRANSTPDLSEPALDSVLFCNFRDMDKDVKGTGIDCFKIQKETKINLDSWSDA